MLSTIFKHVRIWIPVFLPNLDLLANKLLLLKRQVTPRVRPTVKLKHRVILVFLVVMVVGLLGTFVIKVVRAARPADPPTILLVPSRNDLIAHIRRGLRRRTLLRHLELVNRRCRNVLSLISTIGSPVMSLTTPTVILQSLLLAPPVMPLLSRQDISRPTFTALVFSPA